MKGRNQNEIELTGVKSLPYTKDGKVLNDVDFVKKGLEAIDEYRKENGEAPPIHPAFIEFLEDIKKESEGNENFSVIDYKKEHVHKTIPDYGMLKNVN